MRLGTTGPATRAAWRPTASASTNAEELRAVITGCVPIPSIFEHKVARDVAPNVCKMARHLFILYSYTQISSKDCNLDIAFIKIPDILIEKAKIHLTAYCELLGSKKNNRKVRSVVLFRPSNDQTRNHLCFRG